jgi:hypothetical protein
MPSRRGPVPLRWSSTASRRTLSASSAHPTARSHESRCTSSAGPPTGHGYGQREAERLMIDRLIGFGEMVAAVPNGSTAWSAPQVNVHRRLSRLRPTLLLRAAAVPIAAAVLVSQRRTLFAATTRLGHFSLAWLAVGIAAEVMSFAAAAELQHPPADHPSRSGSVSGTGRPLSGWRRATGWPTRRRWPLRSWP